MEDNKVVLAFGELMLRHGVDDIKDITELDKANKNLFVDSFGGSEANVLMALESFGIKTRYFTALPKNEDGYKAINHLKTSNIDTNCILFYGDNIGAYYVATKCTNRALATKYDRDNSAVTKISLNDIDYNKLFYNVKLFHFSGIDLALKGNARYICENLVYEANKRGIKVSFDFNYRENLWKKDSTDEGIKSGKKEAKKIFQNILPFCNYIFGSKLDLVSWFDFEGDFEDFIKKYPSIEYFIARDKKQIDQTHKEVIASIYTQNEKFEMNKAKLFDVKENIGGGDAFDAGILYAILNSKPTLKEILMVGINCYILKHQIQGDVLKGVSISDIEKDICI